MGKTQNVSKICSAAFLTRLRRNHPHFRFDEKSYLEDFRLNLLPGVDCADFEADLRNGDGNELEGKFKAPHSSSALAVNVFAPFKRNGHISDLRLAGESGFQKMAFEVKFPTGLKTRRAPNLDIVVESENGLLAIESKCMEHLSKKAAKFSSAYFAEILDERRNGPWFEEMERLNALGDKYHQHLDAAQLIKHAFGLERHAMLHDLTDVRLLYLFWEPSNASSWSCFEEHRREIEEFAEAVQGSRVSFSAMSYPELWQSWRPDSAPWLIDHLNQIERRYLITL